MDFNLHLGPRVFGQSLKKVHTCSIVYLQHSHVSAGETCPSSFSLLEVWFVGWASLLSPTPRHSSDQSPPSEELTWNDFHIGLILDADWPGESTLPQGSPTNGDTTAWLIGRGQVAPLHFFFFRLQTVAIALSFFLPLLQFCFVAVKKRCGFTSGPHLLIVSTPSECTLDYSPLLLFPSAYHLVGCNYGRCHPNPAPLRLVINYSLPLRVRHNNERVSLRGFSSTMQSFIKYCREECVFWTDNYFRTKLFAVISPYRLAVTLLLVYFTC